MDQNHLLIVGLWGRNMISLVDILKISGVPLRIPVISAPQKTARIDGIERVIAKQNDSLTAYRKSLIHKCVTGQQRVTGADLRREGAGDGIPPPRAGKYINNDVDFLWTSR